MIKGMQENDSITTIFPQTPIDDRGLLELSQQKREQEIEKKRKRFRKWMIVLKVILVFITLYIADRIYEVQKNKVSPPAFTVEQKPQEQAPPEDPYKNTDTTTWTLYRNQKIRVFIRHPSDATVIETEKPALRVDIIYDKNNLNPTEVNESSPSEGYIFRVTPLDVVIRTIDGVTQTKMESFKTKCPSAAIFSRANKTTISGLEARTFEILNCDGDYLVSYVQKFGIYFEIVQLYKGDFGYKQKYRAILEEILRAFKLFPENEIPIGPFKTFVDDKNKISFKHPNLDETCCEATPPPLNELSTIVLLGDKTTFKDNNNFDGVGVYISTNRYRSSSFNNTIESQKKLLKEDYKVVRGYDAVTEDGPIKVGKYDGVILKGYSWRGNDLIYVELPNQYSPRLIVFSIKNLTGEEFQKKVLDILSSFETL